MSSRREEVESLGWLIQGALFAALSEFQQRVLQTAEVVQEATEEGQPFPWVDVVLHDGNRIRVAWLPVAPAGGD